MRSDRGLEDLLRESVRAHLARIAGGDAELVGLQVGEVVNRKPTLHHRAVTIEYSSGPRRVRKRIWVKFLVEGDAASGARMQFDVHRDAWARTSEGDALFPEPYFFEEYGKGGLIGMELIEGRSLRGLFYRRAPLRSMNALTPVFTALGGGLRAFHDSSDVDGELPLADLAGHVRELVGRSGYLSGSERSIAGDRISAAEEAIGDTGLPKIVVHHDCTLRNVVVRESGAPCLLDLDSMVDRGWSRWYDIAVFLINLESQLKYSPIVGAAASGAAWDCFWSGYAGPGLPDGLTPDQVDGLLFMIKLEYLVGGPWRPLYEVYDGRLNRRYLSRLKASLLRGEAKVAAR